MTADGEVPVLLQRECRCTRDESWGVFAEIPLGTPWLKELTIALRMDAMLRDHVRTEHKHKRSWFRWLSR